MWSKKWQVIYGAVGEIDVSRDAWVTFAVVAAIVAALAANLAGPDLVLVAGVTLLLALGVLDPADAFVGFANPAVVTIGALLVVAAGVRETGALEYTARRVLGQPRSLAAAQLRLMLPVSALSAFLNNTPVVAMFVPVVETWSKRMQRSASLFLMPLSYAAILGGTCTLIGTSTNLVVAGMAVDHQPDLTFGIFEIGVIGLPVLVLGTLYMVLISPRLLSARRSASAVLADSREYTIALQVERGAPVIGQTIEEAGLRSLEQLYLYEIERNEQVLPAVAPTTVIAEGDVLRFTGVVDAAKDLRKLRLVPATDQVHKLEGPSGRGPQRGWIEAVVAPQSNLVGRTVRESQFRTRYNAAIIAVHRHGERITAKIGDIVPQAGDVLLLEGYPTFARKHRGDPNFALVRGVQESAPPRHEKAPLAFTILLAMVASNALGLLPLVTASLLAAGVMLATGCIHGNVARRALDLRVLLTVGAALGIGHAMDHSGAAAALGTAVVSGTAELGTPVLLATLFATTALLAGAVYAATAAALMFPVVAVAAEVLQMELRPMAYLVMMAASTAFSTPIGYAANLIVYGPGGYRFTDFLKVGLPLQGLVGVVTISVLMWRFF